MRPSKPDRVDPIDEIYPLIWAAVSSGSILLLSPGAPRNRIRIRNLSSPSSPGTHRYDCYAIFPMNTLGAVFT